MMTSEQRIQALQAELDTLRQQLAEMDLVVEEAIQADAENTTLRQQLADEQAAREAAEEEDARFRLKLGLRYSELLKAVVDYFVTKDAITDSEGEFGWQALEENWEAEKRLRAAAAKLKEAQS